MAVPAQRRAGVMKRYAPGETEADEKLRKEAALGRKYLDALRKEVVRLALVADEDLDGPVFEGIAKKLEEPELLELKRAYEARAQERFPAQPQLRDKAKALSPDEEGVFLV